MAVLILNGVLREFREFLLDGRDSWVNKYSRGLARKWPWVSKKNIRVALEYWIPVDNPLMERCRRCPMETGESWPKKAFAVVIPCLWGVGACQDLREKMLDGQSVVDLLGSHPFIISYSGGEEHGLTWVEVVDGGE